MPLPDWTAAETTPIVAPAPEQAGVGGAWRAADPDILGTRMNIVAVAAHEAAALGAFSAVHGEVVRLERILNGRRAGAELARWNEGAGGRVSSDLFDVLAHTEHWRRATGGAYDGRLGALVDLWRDATFPDPATVQTALPRGEIGLDAATLTARKPADMRLALDGLAKGWIVDAALEAGRRIAGVRGLLVDIGGDMRAWGDGPDGAGWRISVGNPLSPDDDAGVALANISGAAIATSGRGPRDRTIAGKSCSQTLSPFTGQPVSATATASVIAPRAADADALATAFMVMDPVAAIAMANAMPHVAARITGSDGSVHASDRWLVRTQATVPSPKQATPRDQLWPPDWGIEIAYVAPDKKDHNDEGFRTPYMALWITDANNRPVRTVTMVGQSAKWQADNFIWWRMYRPNPQRIVDLRSQATAFSGRYNLFWRGIDDDWNDLPMGDYVLHIETSQERGKHSHRTLPLRIGKEPFEAELPATKEGGGLQISYGLKRG